jgi:hypothetical protein
MDFAGLYGHSDFLSYSALTAMTEKSAVLASWISADPNLASIRICEALWSFVCSDNFLRSKGVTYSPGMRDMPELCGACRFDPDGPLAA